MVLAHGVYISPLIPQSFWPPQARPPVFIFQPVVISSNSNRFKVDSDIVSTMGVISQPTKFLFLFVSLFFGALATLKMDAQEQITLSDNLDVQNIQAQNITFSDGSQSGGRGGGGVSGN